MEFHWLDFRWATSVSSVFFVLVLVWSLSVSDTAICGPEYCFYFLDESLQVSLGNRIELDGNP